MPEFDPKWREEVAIAMSKHFEARTRGCWPATCYRHPSGHAMVKIPTKYVAEGNSPRQPRYLARVMYELYVGEIPERAHVHHICGNQGCANPRHLELLDSAREHRLHHIGGGCRNGHPWTDANTYIETVRDRKGTRQRRRCRICLAAKMRRYNAKRRAEGRES